MELDLGLEAEKWKTEFGGISAENMTAWVEVVMSDYEFLREKILRLGKK